MTSHLVGQALEVEWYKRNGLHPTKRITRDSGGNLYVIGDWSWNRGGRSEEFIEARLNDEIWRPLNGSAGAKQGEPA